MNKKIQSFNNEKTSQIYSHCHIATNTEGDFFVGIQADSHTAKVYFPLGYDLPTTDKEIRKDIKNLIKVLKEFTTKEQRLLSLKKESKVKVIEFPISAYIDVLEYYLSLGCNYYVEDDISFKRASQGKINWKRTVQTETPLIQNKNGFSSLIFTDFVVKTRQVNENKLITQINKFCVSEAFNKIGWFYNINEPQAYNINLDLNVSISLLKKKLQNSCNDKKNTLFNAMINMLKFLGQTNTNHYVYYGIDNFEYVWEKIIDKAFGIQNKNEYFPHAYWLLGPHSKKMTHALQPDTIMRNKDDYYILDAKYYKFGVTGEAKDLPNSSSIHKQITYGEYLEVQKNIHNDNIFNAFIMPFNMNSNNLNLTNSLELIGKARSEWKDNNKNYHTVLGLLIDTRTLMFYYSNKSQILKNRLVSIINESFPKNIKLYDDYIKNDPNTLQYVANKEPPYL